MLVVLVVAVVGFGAKVYFDVKGSMNETYESVKREDSARDTAVDLSKQEAFSVLLLGIDTGDLGRTEQGRSDTMMVATVNPQDKQTTLVSIARDTYVPIIGHENNAEDKINHAYAFGGAAMSMATVENYLDIPIDHYVAINMKGLKELVDAVGGSPSLTMRRLPKMTTPSMRARLPWTGMKLWLTPGCVRKTLMATTADKNGSGKS